MSTLPDDVRRWIDQQAPDERAALARTWDLSALADDTPASSKTDAAWHRLDALLDTHLPVNDTRDELAIQNGLRAWQDRDAAGADAVHVRPTAIPASSFARRAVWSGLLAAAIVAIAAVLWLRPVTTASGASPLAVLLPDGSAVTLAPGSEIAYARGLRGAGRRVNLAGQATFDVARDGRPFAVETFNASVEVLGTVFDVQAWPASQAPETAVALVEGSVRLRSDAGAVTLRPGEASRVMEGAPTAPVPVDARAVIAWHDGAFSVVDAPLGAVAEALQARFGRRVRLAPGVDASRRLTVFLPSADSADVVLRDVAAYLDLRVQVVADRYDVLPR